MQQFSRPAALVVHGLAVHELHPVVVVETGPAQDGVGGGGPGLPCASRGLGGRCALVVVDGVGVAASSPGIHAAAGVSSSPGSLRGRAYESLLYLLGNSLVVVLHLGLMLVASLAGIGMQRLVVGVAAGAEEESGLAVVAGQRRTPPVLVALLIAVLGLLSVAVRVWRDRM